MSVGGAVAAGRLRADLARPPSAPTRGRVGSLISDSQAPSAILRTMATRERPADRGRRLARADRTRAGTEIRDARVAANVSLRSMAAEARMSPAQAARIERGELPGASIDQIGRLAAVVGLDARLRLYPGPEPLRDAGHV